MALLLTSFFIHGKKKVLLVYLLLNRIQQCILLVRVYWMGFWLPLFYSNQKRVCRGMKYDWQCTSKKISVQFSNISSLRSQNHLEKQFQNETPFRMQIDPSNTNVRHSTRFQNRLCQMMFNISKRMKPNEFTSLRNHYGQNC